jgi:hypothetical protein
MSTACGDCRAARLLDLLAGCWAGPLDLDAGGYSRPLNFTSAW